MKNKTAARLFQKIEDRSAVIGVIGLGYVGLPLAIEFCRAGFPMIGFDLDADKVKKINTGKSYIRHIKSSQVKEITSRADSRATTNFKLLPRTDAILICVPTPLNPHREPDMSFIQSTVETISRHLRPGQLIILESTTYPGTTRGLVLRILEEGGLKAGRDFFLAFSPEREDPGNPVYSTSVIPKVVGGLTVTCLKLARKLYDTVVIKTIPVSNPDAAEATKLLENIFRSVNIALVNELKIVFEEMGINIWEVIAAASSKPFGFMPFYPGPGLGGHCIPIDPFYLTWRAREFNIPTRFIELAGEINTSMPEYVVSRLMKSLNDRKKSLKNSRILLLGMAYKNNVDDMRESPSLRLIELLCLHQAKVEYHDPFIPSLPHTRKYRYRMRSIPLTPARLRNFDAAIIATAHDGIDYRLVGNTVPLIIDTRNAMAAAGKVKARVVRA